MQHDRAALEQALAEGLFLIVVDGSFRHRIQLAHRIGDAGLFEGPARPEIADLAARKGRNPVEGADADCGIGIDWHQYRISFAGGQADGMAPSAARWSTAMSMRFIF